MHLIHHLNPLAIVFGMGIMFAAGPMTVHGQIALKWRVAYRLPKNADQYDKQDPLGTYAFTDFSPDGKVIAAGYRDGNVSLYDARDGSLLR
ncbi:MAG: hypothetical protein CMJ48_02205 [Planctomycetaceae bacterium]|nr:hypothetical protein [Planctomycetaceae bacterium]